MPVLDIHLFGRFAIDVHGHPLSLKANLKAKELFAFLLLNPDRPHSRDVLVDTLWDNELANQGRKHLRQVLWVLQRMLRAAFEKDQGTLLADFLVVEPDVVTLRRSADVRVDTQVLEQAYLRTRGIAGPTLHGESLSTLDAAVGFDDELLTDLYGEWLAAPREYFRIIALAALEKLMIAHETRGDQDAAVICAARVFRIEPAHEPAHRTLMRIYYRAGNRAAALHQFDRMRTALGHGFDVQPDRESVALLQSIRSGDWIADPVPSVERDFAHRLDQLHAALTAIHVQLESDLVALEMVRAQMN